MHSPPIRQWTVKNYNMRVSNARLTVKVLAAVVEIEVKRAPTTISFILCFAEEQSTWDSSFFRIGYLYAWKYLGSSYSSHSAQSEFEAQGLLLNKTRISLTSADVQLRDQHTWCSGKFPHDYLEVHLSAFKRRCINQKSRVVGRSQFKANRRSLSMKSSIS